MVALMIKNPLNAFDQIEDDVYNEDDDSKEGEANPFAFVGNFLTYND